jgi:hypothetical protein
MKFLTILVATVLVLSSASQLRTKSPNQILVQVDSSPLGNTLLSAIHL